MDFKSSSNKNKMIPQAEMLASVGGQNWTFKCAVLVVLFLRNDD